MMCNHERLFFAIIFAHLLLPLMSDLLKSAEIIQNRFVLRTRQWHGYHKCFPCYWFMNKHCLLDLFRCIFSLFRLLLSFSCMFSKVTIVHCLNQHIVCMYVHHLYGSVLLCKWERREKSARRWLLIARCLQIWIFNCKYLLSHFFFAHLLFHTWKRSAAGIIFCVRNLCLLYSNK